VQTGLPTLSAKRNSKKLWGRKHAFERQPSPPRSKVRVRQIDDTRWEFVHPRCVRERDTDLEEVHKMLEAGELDVARDELRWLLDDCGDFIEAHTLLGQIAEEDNDPKLARAHCGYAYHLGTAALPPNGLVGTLPPDLPANRPFYEAGQGFAWALAHLSFFDEAHRVVETLLRLDPADSLNIRKLGAQIEDLEKYGPGSAPHSAEPVLVSLSSPPGGFALPIVDAPLSSGPAQTPELSAGPQVPAINADATDAHTTEAATTGADAPGDPPPAAPPDGSPPTT